jgi:hypothetical protein
VTIRRSNGRVVRGHVAPGAARRDDLEALRRVTASNTGRAFAAIRHNARAIDALARSQRQLAMIVAELQARGDLSLLDGLLDRLSGLGKQLGEQQRVLASQTRSQRAIGKGLRLQDRAASIQKLSNAASSMQFAAFGTSGELLSQNNLVLAGNQLLWGFSDKLLGALGLTTAGPSILAWLAPVGSLLTSKIALRNQQHQRFVSGIATGFQLDSNAEFASVSIPLEGRIASDLFPSFRTREDVPVTATLLDTQSRVSLRQAVVRQGVLTIVIRNDDEESDVEGVRVAWMVDTGVGRG